MEKLGFWTAVTYEGQKTTCSEKSLEQVDSLLNFSYLGCKTVKVIQPGKVILAENNSSWLFTAVKVALLFTVVTPLLLLIAKAILHSTHTFDLVDKKQPPSASIIVNGSTSAPSTTKITPPILPNKKVSGPEANKRQPLNRPAPINTALSIGSPQSLNDGDNEQATPDPLINSGCLYPEPRITSDLHSVPEETALDMTPPLHPANSGSPNNGQNVRDLTLDKPSSNSSHQAQATLTSVTTNSPPSEQSALAAFTLDNPLLDDESELDTSPTKGNKQSDNLTQENTDASETEKELKYTAEMDTAPTSQNNFFSTTASSTPPAGKLGFESNQIPNSSLHSSPTPANPAPRKDLSFSNDNPLDEDGEIEANIPASPNLLPQKNALDLELSPTVNTPPSPHAQTDSSQKEKELKEKADTLQKDFATTTLTAAAHEQEKTIDQFYTDNGTLENPRKKVSENKNELGLALEEKQAFKESAELDSTTQFSCEYIADQVIQRINRTLEMIPNPQPNQNVQIKELKQQRAITLSYDDKEIGRFLPAWETNGENSLLIKILDALKVKGEIHNYVWTADGFDVQA